VEPSSIGQYVIPAISATATLVGVILAARKGAGHRSRIKEDAEILASLKEGTPAHSALTKHIEWEIAELQRFETVGERQWGLGIMALLATAGLTILSTWLVLEGGLTMLWLILTVPFTLVFIYGMVDTFSKLPRDEKGKTIRGGTS
jgi:hypothetical protein